MYMMYSHSIKVMYLKSLEFFVMKTCMITASEKKLDTDENENDYAWLQAIEAPDNLHMRSGKYTGPAVQVNSNHLILCSSFLSNLNSSDMFISCAVEYLTGRVLLSRLMHSSLNRFDFGSH